MGNIDFVRDKMMDHVRGQNAGYARGDPKVEHNSTIVEKWRVFKDVYLVSVLIEKHTHTHTHNPAVS